MGVRGLLPLGCIPLRGREGVALLPAVRYYANNGKKSISPNPENSLYAFWGFCWDCLHPTGLSMMHHVQTEPEGALRLAEFRSPSHEFYGVPMSI